MISIIVQREKEGRSLRTEGTAQKVTSEQQGERITSDDECEQEWTGDTSQKINEDELDDETNWTENEDVVETSRSTDVAPEPVNTTSTRYAEPLQRALAALAGRKQRSQETRNYVYAVIFGCESFVFKVGCSSQELYDLCQYYGRAYGMMNYVIQIYVHGTMKKVR